MVMGFVYVILYGQQHHQKALHLSFKCDFAEADCNAQWRTLFTLRPDILLDLWLPVLMGLLGISLHVSSLRFCALFESLLPNGYVGYGMHMIFLALFANW
eukprot:CAMPEP_0206476648 /NCGR_PEP_ID=MMETSP0324_2-20121206/34856_1 /ASSEMBLY_ACC=CAM_ASM_000836 /TAXON_ID=2866 /ORGANISM="Crypthecodinium cohnii, Strain Seligo" /LENGTH=99 /DNA_ID=CAMNT_0053952349 /DNA_START=108 /DNA_END=404 /DNA_ORIENTATION=-